MKVLLDLKKITGVSLVSLEKCWSAHKPIVDYAMFYNDHDEVSKKLREVISLLKEENIKFSIYELDEDMEYVQNSETELDKIDEETLINILDSHSNRY